MDFVVWGADIWGKMIEKKPGVMAPPDADEQPAQPGLMRPSPQAPRPEVSLRTLLWAIAAVLAAVELFLETLP
jgi:hypothetical protein